MEKISLRLNRQGAYEVEESTVEGVSVKTYADGTMKVAFPTVTVEVENVVEKTVVEEIATYIAAHPVRAPEATQPAPKDPKPDKKAAKPKKGK